MRYLILTLSFFVFSLTANAALPPITGVFIVCNGSTTTLSNSVSGGTWSSSNLSVATVDASSGVVSGLSLGTAVIQYTDGTDIASATVTVNPVPVISSGPVSIGIGCSVALSGAPLGGLWTSSSPAIASISVTSGSLTGVSLGTAVISYRLAGCSTTTVVTVVPSTIAPITGTATVCTGLAVLLSHADPGGTWATDAPAIASIDASGVATGNSVGTTTVTYVAPSGCIATRVLTVNTTPAPISGTASLCPGTTTALGGTPGVTGTWSSTTPSVATVDASGVVTGLVSGTTTISYTVSTCGTVTKVVTVNNMCSVTPVTGVVAASPSVVCSGLPLVLDLPAYVPACGHVIQWQYSTDGLGWSNLSGANTVPYTYYPTSAYFYRCSISCPSGGTSAFSGPIYVGIDFEFGANDIVGAPSTTCDATHFYVAACGVSSAFRVVTYFGDGSVDTNALSTTTLSDVDLYHTYTLPGTYTIKQILLNGSAEVDTAIFDYNYDYCRTLPVKFYFDANSNCIYDTGDVSNLTAVTTRVDSNGVAIDTIVATSGFYYKAHGVPGTVYAFTPISVAGSGALAVTCPAAGVIYDTITAFANTYQAKYFGVGCGASTDFDVRVEATAATGRHTQVFDILVSNQYCNPATPTIVTLKVNSKYGYYPLYSYTFPVPTSVVGNVITWNLGTLDAEAVRSIHVRLERPMSTFPLLPTGDTINTTISVTPTLGDLNPFNNIINRVDTVKSSFDPNDIAVKPEGHVLPCDRLQYKVRFENTGNDTAHNIYVLDTLSDGLDPSTLEVEIASAAMNVSVINDGVRNIARFDFPNIKLLDSSYHNLCNGMFIFNIKAKDALVDGTEIKNRVGIYFDGNPVVMTNEVTNTIGVAPLTGSAFACIGSSDTLRSLTPGGIWSSSDPDTATVVAGEVDGLLAGTATISFTVSNACTSRSATRIMTVNPIVTPGVTIVSSAGDSSCVGAPVVFRGVSTHGGVTPAYSWMVNSSIVSGDTSYTYVPTDGDTLSLVIGSTAACAIPSIASDTMELIVIPTGTPVANVMISPDDTACEGLPVTFTAMPFLGGTTPGFKWFVNGSLSGSGDTYVYVPASGDVVYCRMGSDFLCRLADTVNSTDINMVVDPLYIPIVSIDPIAPGLSVEAGSPLTLHATVTGAGPSPEYQWIVNSTVILGATTNTFTSSTFNDYDSVTCQVIGDGVCQISSFNSVYIAVSPLGVASVMDVSEVRLFPNPNMGGFKLTGNIGKLSNKTVAISIHDVVGKVVFTSHTVTGVDGKLNEEIHMPENLANGMYILSLRSDNENKLFRFVVNR